MNSQKMQQLVEQELLSSYDSLYRLAFTYVKNEADAMDIVQESSYRAIKNSSSVKNAAFIRTWIWRIVINTSLELLRRNQKKFLSMKRRSTEQRTFTWTSTPLTL